MKKILCLISVLVLIFAVAACNKKKKDEIPGYEEQVSKEISAEEGGKVESSDGKTSIEIPGGALDEDTTITMTIYDASGYSDGNGKILSKVVNFEPNGTIFKKPVIISMTSLEKVENRIIAAAVLHETEGKWSYSETGAAVMISGKDAAGDPIMTSAAGDPIMISAAGDPIMMSAAGDPIMMSAAGDPIMVTAAGDPIMNAAAGDPIMMTTGHFSSYTFIATESKGSAEKPDEASEEPEKDDEISDEDEDIDISDIEIAEEDDDIPDEEIPDETEDEDEIPDEDGDEEVIVPEPDPVYSKVVCTGLRNCFDENGEPLSECPKEGVMSGQDAGYIFRKSCVLRKFEALPIPEDFNEDEPYYQMTQDNNTGLTWLFSAYEEDKNSQSKHSEFCNNLEYDGHDDWRLPTPQEALTIADYDIFNGDYEFMALKASVFPDIAGYAYGWQYFWTSKENFYYSTEKGEIAAGQTYVENTGTMCVRGEEYGKVEASDYTSVNNNGEEMILDSKTDLYWQKTSVNGKTWKEALAYCESLEYAGKSDWRLPSRNELATLIDYSKSNPASSFPGIPSAVFATSTYIINSGEIAVNMGTGEVVAENESV